MSSTDRPSQHSINEMQDKADAEAKQGDDVIQAKVEPDEADSEAIIAQDLGASSLAAAHLRIMRAAVQASVM
ncbi:hypothetical protein LTR24_000894 [Lithohypha guttulata]|uniref:Uncharacterized protein n=1 Tax=Lithohypha guttulata TaxID=1690604 RepID=A0ABR0KME3_9EURO|nr:hypothetical protein LTR24_000894 [Lithohypha guttulata]